MSYALVLPPRRRSPLRNGYGALGAAGRGGLGDSVSDFVDEAGQALYDKFMGYATQGVATLEDQAIARAKSELDADLPGYVSSAMNEALKSLDDVVNQAVDTATPKIKETVLATITDAFQSATVQEMLATTKKQLAIGAAVFTVVLIGGVYLAARSARA